MTHNFSPEIVKQNVCKIPYAVYQYTYCSLIVLINLFNIHRTMNKSSVKKKENIHKFISQLLIAHILFNNTAHTQKKNT